MERASRNVALWLLLCALGVWGMVLLGGFTRLTGSGLSIVEWKPVSGVLPPLDAAAWEAEFAAYRASPEYRLVNAGMTLEGFQGIFWLEYWHRVVGRLLGVLFFVPLVFFAWRRQLPARLVPWLIAAGTLGALQGLVGWWMVSSGLVKDPHVSPYRLVTHLGLALAILAVLLWAALELRLGHRPARASPLARVTLALAGLIFVTALWGGFMAGLKAGHAWNTFPKLGSEWFPDGVWAGTPWWRNLFENVLTVQLLHRWLGKAVLLASLGAATWLLRQTRDRATRLAALTVASLAVLQLLLGVGTLLLRVPLPWAVAHQFTAAVLLGAAVVLAQCARRAVPEERPRVVAGSALPAR